MEGVIEDHGAGVFSVMSPYSPFFRGIIGLMIKAYFDKCIESGRVATGGVMEECVYAWRCGAGCFLRVYTGRLCSARWVS